ncbi:MAG: hypothetical protein V7749_00650 [Cocleimonas sp.]
MINKISKCKRTRHLMTPVDALNVVLRLLKSVPDAELEHVAFALGISRGQLSKELKHLQLCITGDQKSCEKYNTRRQFMRNLYLWDNATKLTVVHIMEDALLFGNNGNIASTRGQSEESGKIIGILEGELTVIQSELEYLEAEGYEGALRTLKLVKKEDLSLKTSETNKMAIAKPVQNMNDARSKVLVKITEQHPNYTQFCKTKGLNPEHPQTLKVFKAQEKILADYLSKTPTAKLISKKLDEKF